MSKHDYYGGEDVNILDDCNQLAIDMDYKRITELTSDDIFGLEFASESEACEFYSIYAKCHGFVSRRDDIRCNQEGNIVMHQLVCN